MKQKKSSRFNICLKVIICFFAVVVCSMYTNTQVKASVLSDAVLKSGSASEQQFWKKIQIIKSIFPNQIDDVALAATILYNGSSSGILMRQYDVDFDDSEYRDSINSLKDAINEFQNNLDGKYAPADEKNADILIAATIVMLDSSGWIGSYSDEKYEKALAGDRLVGNMVDENNAVANAIAEIFNAVFCSVGAALDTAVTPFQFGADILTGNTDPVGTKVRRYYRMADICANGFIGGTNENVRHLTDAGEKATKKRLIAREIIKLAETYRKIFEQKDTGSGNGTCYYQVSGIDETVSDLKVQTINSEWGNVKGGEPYDDIPGEGLIDFEDVYIPGVVRSEVGGGSLETKKTQAVAARSFALTRGKEMGGSKVGKITIENGQWVLRIRTSTDDQVFCHPDQGCSSQGSAQGTTSGANTIYAGTTTASKKIYDALPEDDESRQAAKETRGEVAVDGSGNVVYTNFASDEQNAWASMTASGSTYKQALMSTYNSMKDVSAHCESVNSKYDLDSYVEASNNASQSSNIPATDLSSTVYKDVAGFNKHIQDSINASGYGTRDGVVAAGIALIGDYTVATGKRLRYQQTNRQSANTIGIVNSDFYMDCSSFAWWTLYNAGFKPPCAANTNSINAWAKEKGYLKSSGGQAGDFLISSGHIMLIVGTNSNGYYVAHFANSIQGAKINETSGNDYSVIDMSEYYNDANNKR